MNKLQIIFVSVTKNITMSEKHSIKAEWKGNMAFEADVNGHAENVRIYIIDTVLLRIVHRHNQAVRCSQFKIALGNYLLVSSRYSQQNEKE